MAFRKRIARGRFSCKKEPSGLPAEQKKQSIAQTRVPRIAVLSPAWRFSFPQRRSVLCIWAQWNAGLLACLGSVGPGR
jgi:hypothetical protein